MESPVPALRDEKEVSLLAVERELDEDGYVRELISFESNF